MHIADSLTHSLNNFLCRQNKANLPFWASLRRPHSVVCLHLETLWAFLWCQLREKKVIFDVWLGEWCQKVTLGKSLADNFSTVKFSLTFLIWLTIMSTSVLEYPCVYLDITQWNFFGLFTWLLIIFFIKKWWKFGQHPTQIYSISWVTFEWSRANENLITHLTQVRVLFFFQWSEQFWKAQLKKDKNLIQRNLLTIKNILSIV